jgi:hypothetical protein
MAKAAASQGARASSNINNGPGASPLMLAGGEDFMGHASLDWIFMPGAQQRHPIATMCHVTHAPASTLEGCP